MTSDVRVVATPTAEHEASDQTHGWEAEPCLVQGILAWSRWCLECGCCLAQLRNTHTWREMGDVEMEGRGTARDGNWKRLICPCLARFVHQLLCAMTITSLG